MSPSAMNIKLENLSGVHSVDHRRKWPCQQLEARTPKHFLQVVAAMEGHVSGVKQDIGNGTNDDWPGCVLKEVSSSRIFFVFIRQIQVFERLLFVQFIYWLNCLLMTHPLHFWNIFKGCTVIKQPFIKNWHWWWCYGLSFWSSSCPLSKPFLLRFYRYRRLFYI